MPKMKTKSGAAKRFRARGSGKFKRSHAFLRHILTKKSTKRKRNCGTWPLPIPTNQVHAPCCPTLNGGSPCHESNEVTARARHKKVMDAAKGYRGRRKNVFRIAKEAVMKAGQYAYRDRRQRKRQFRTLWIARINAASRELGMSYSQFMNGLKKAQSRSTARCWRTSPFSTRTDSPASRSRPKRPDRLTASVWEGGLAASFFFSMTRFKPSVQHAFDAMTEPTACCRSPAGFHGLP